MHFNKLISLGVLTVLSTGFFNTAYADEISVIGSLSHSFHKSNQNMAVGSVSDSTKTIQLLHVQLSENEKNWLKNYNPSVTPKTAMAGSSVPSYMQLGMNGVPVLDQGIHGTCTTFAVTAVLDATIGKGDYISQVCNLQLGSYLEKAGYGESGWDGLDADTLLARIQQYGIVNKGNQHKFGCGGYTDYPSYANRVRSSYMEPKKFSSISEAIYGRDANWATVFRKYQPNQTLDEVKDALSAGDRLAFAVLLPRLDLGTVGAVGKYKTWFTQDTWLLTPEVKKGLNSIEAAHEMIITGYDDNAVATDNHGVKHKGLLTLRNSWGTDAGYWGEFYMSYDYFKLLSFDLTRFTPTH